MAGKTTVSGVCFREGNRSNKPSRAARTDTPRTHLLITCNVSTRHRVAKHHAGNTPHTAGPESSCLHYVSTGHREWSA
eukprot:3837623-Rhodomonas_salina.1